jgi:hypothetical protein
MVIAFVGSFDWSNLSNRVTRAINRCGREMRARTITALPHPFGFDEDIVLHRDGEAGIEAARAVVRQADWIIHTGDGHYPHFHELLAVLGLPDGYHTAGKHYATRHAGSAFRDNPGHYEVADRPFARRFVACDLFRHVQHDPRARPYVHPMGDWEWPTEPRPAHDPLRLCHTPSNPARKGTEWITREMEPLQSSITFEVITDAPPREAFGRRAACDVLIDQDEPTVGGFGCSAVEALCQGVAVLANLRHVKTAYAAIERWIDVPAIGDLDSMRIADWLQAWHMRPETLATRRQHGLDWSRRHTSDAAVYRYWHRCLTRED